MIGFWLVRAGLLARPAMLGTCVLGAWAAVGAETDKTNQHDSHPVVWSDHTLAFAPECAATLGSFPKESLCMVEPALDGQGRLHVFIAYNAILDRESGRREIEHLLLSEVGVERLPSIPVEHSTPIAIRAATAPSGEVLLLWAEAEYRNPRFHDRAMFLATWRDGAWVDRRPVLDDEARPFLVIDDHVDLRVSRDGSVDVFWADGRDRSFGAGLLSVCDDGRRTKTYHRRLTSDTWNESARVQSKSSKELFDFAAAPAGSGVPDLYWSQQSGKIARLLRSRFSKGRWQLVDTVGECTSSPGSPMILFFSANIAAGNRPSIAWVCSRYEYTEPGTKKNNSFDVLYLSRFEEDRWIPGPMLAHNAVHFRWLRDSLSQSVLLLQEREPGRRGSSDRPIPLQVVTADRSGHVRKQIVAAGSIEGFGEAVEDGQGKIHLIYGERISATESVLQYRRGRFQSESQPVSPAAP